MPNALSWIVKEAKRLRKRFPHRYDKLANAWRDGYMAEASAIYAKKHKGKSPVGKKKNASGQRARKVIRPKKAKKKRVGKIVTKSKSHTDYNRNKVNISVGSISHHKAMAKKGIEEKIATKEIRKFKARTKREKAKLQKEITALKREYRKLL